MIIQKSRNYRLETERGFTALISVIVISVILLLLATNLGLTGFYDRSNILDFELKEKSSALAEACADTMILKLANNSSYVGGETVIVSGSDTCIINTTVATNPRIFTIKADYRNYVTNLKIVINTTNMSIVSWEEI